MVAHAFVRWWRNQAFNTRTLRRELGPDGSAAIEKAVAASEKMHSAEIGVALESRLPRHVIFHDIPVRQHARSHFVQTGVWDTSQNNGILLYVLLSERAVEIVADRGYDGRVPPEAWASICSLIGSSIASSGLLAGVLTGIEQLTSIAAEHFPPGAKDTNEVSDRPTIA